MAVNATTLAELNDLAKDYYTDVLQPQQNTATALKAQFDRLENFEIAGRKTIFAVKLTNGGGASNAGPDKTLPGRGMGTFDQAEVRNVRTYARMSADLFAAEITKKSKGSYRPFVAELMDDRQVAMDLEINRQMFSNGDGKIANTTTAGAGTTQALANDYGVTNGGSGTRHVTVGDYVHFHQSNGTSIGKRTVTAVDHAAGTIDVDSTVTSTSGGFISKATADTDNYAEGECLGLLSATAQSSTFQGITIGAGGTWKMHRIHNSGTPRPVSDPLVVQTVMGIKSRSREMPNLAVTRPGVQVKYSEIFLPIRRIDGVETPLKGGYKPVAVIQTAGQDIPVLTDEDCPDHRVFFLNTKYIKNIDLIGTDWADFDGAQFRQIDGKDAVEAYLRRYWGLAWTRLNAHGVLEDLEDIASLDRF